MSITEETIKETQFNYIKNSDISSILPLINSKNNYRKILKSLEGKNIRTVEDLLNRHSNPLWVEMPNKQFSILSKELEAEINQLIHNKESTQTYIYLQDELELPFYEKDRKYTIKESIDLFFAQYIKGLKDRNDNKAALIISDIYKSKGKIDSESIELDLSRERIRQIKEDALALFSGGKYLNFKLNISLLEKLNNIKESCLYKDLSFFYENLDSKSLTNEETIFFANILSLQITSVINFSEQQFVVNDREVIAFNNNIKAIIALLRDEIIPISQNDIIERIDNRTMVINILNNHSWIEPVEINNELYFQVKWKYLSSIDAKAKRIIYESEKSISKNDILLAYNYQASLYSDEKIELEQLIIKQRKKDNFACQKNGYWHYGDKKKEVRLFISEFIRGKNGKATFTDINKALEEKEYEYPSNTIRAYILESCRVSKNDSNLFIHKDYIEQYKDIHLRNPIQKDIGNRLVNIAVKHLKESPNYEKEYRILAKEIKIKLCEEGFSITSGNINQYITKYIELNILNKKDEIISLDIDELIKYNLDELGKRNREPEYKKKIRSLIINYLKREEHNQAYLKDLFKRFKDEIPEQYSTSVFYKLFEENSILKKREEGREKVIYLDVESLPKAQPFQEEATEEIPIVHEYITYIPYDLIKLKTRLSSELRGYFDNDNTVNIGNAIDSFIDYLSVGGKSTSWGDGILKAIYDLFFSKSDYFDRESYLYRLVMNYEAYLKNIKIIKDATYNLNEVNGLSKALDLFEETKLLKNRNFPQYTLESRFAKIFSSLRYYRNAYAHSGNSIEDVALFYQVKMSVDNIALYVYTAWLLK